jgi:hypothetical protein
MIGKGWLTKRVYAKEFTLSLVLAPLFLVLAQSAEKQKLTLSSINDNWGWGYTQIKDDYRSFGFSAQYDFIYKNQWSQIILEQQGFTSRLQQDSARLDELKLALQWPLWSVKEQLVFSALIGGYYTGNLGGEALQNYSHQNLAVAEIRLPYPEKDKVYALLGAQVRYNFFKAVKTSFINQLYAKANYHYAPNYLNSFNGQLSVGHQNSYLDALTLSLGYNHQNVFRAGARQQAAKVESGFYTRFSSNLGLAHFELTIYPGQNFSTGSLGLNLLHWRARKGVKEIDFTAEYGGYVNGLGLYQRYLLKALPKRMPHFQVDIHQQFWRINGSLNPDFPQQFGHFQQTSLGLNYSPFKLTGGWQLLPYASARLGYLRQNIYSGQSSLRPINSYSLLAIGELGLRLKLPANFIHKNCYYGASTHYSYAQNLYTSTTNGQATRYNFSLNPSRIGFGLFVMVDL